METLTIFLLLGITFVVLWYIFFPLISKNFSISTNNSAYSQLVAERERMIDILIELDFDHKLGKIPDGDYANQREELVSKGGIILEKIELINKSNQQLVAKDEITTMSDKDIARMLEMRRAQKSETVNYFCPECGKSVLQSDRYCPSCGNKIMAQIKSK